MNQNLQRQDPLHQVITIRLLTGLFIYRIIVLCWEIGSFKEFIKHSKLDIIVLLVFLKSMFQKNLTNRYTPFSGIFSIFTKQHSKKMEKTLPALFCLDCFEAGKLPRFYSLCRASEDTKRRHKKAHHQGQGIACISSMNLVSSRDDAGKDALKYWQSYSEKKDSDGAVPKVILSFC